MKPVYIKFFHALIFFLLTLNSFAQDYKRFGLEKIAALLVDRNEVTNVAYLEFLFYQKRALSADEYQNLVPQNDLYSHPDNRQIPVTNITYEAARAYCQWRSYIVNEKFGLQFEFRLPSPSEWSEIAKYLASEDAKYQLKSLNKATKNVKKNKNAYVMAAAQKADEHVHNFFDNVSEMTDEKGIAMGANNSNLKEMSDNFSAVIKYDKPHSYVGFRCVATPLQTKEE